jgi:hypothetical protein
MILPLRIYEQQSWLIALHELKQKKGKGVTKPWISNKICVATLGYQ